MVDVVSKRRLGRIVAGGHYQCWKHGVVSEDVYRGIENSPAFRVDEERYSEAGKWIELKGVLCKLNPEEESIVDYVATEFGKLDQDALGLLTKRMNTHIPTSKWGSNATAAVGDDAYSRLSEQWQHMCEQLNKLDFTTLDAGARELNSDEDLLRLVS